MHTSPLYLAAVDLGSNSFHMLISQWQDGKLTEVARQKVMVQLARGMDSERRLTPDALTRAQACLVSFKHLLEQYPCHSVRVIGTQALRQCSNLDEFLQLAEPILGTPVDIISGEQEAQLVYRGVQYYLPAEYQHSGVLVLDMGGASTEFIIGHGRQIQRWRSLPLGCVDLANRFFPAGQAGPVTAAAMEQTYQYGCSLLEPLRPEFDARHWQLALGASGTLRVALELLPDKVPGTETPLPAVITRGDLHALLAQLKQTGELSDIIPDALRWDVLPAGLVLLQAVFDTLQLSQLTVSPGSLKEGLMLDNLC